MIQITDANGNKLLSPHYSKKMSESPSGSKLPPLLTVEEMRQFLRIGKGSAYSLVRSGRIRSIRIGRDIRIPREAIDEFLRSAS